MISYGTSTDRFTWGHEYFNSHFYSFFFSNLFINVAFESYMKAKIVHEIHYSCKATLIL